MTVASAARISPLLLITEVPPPKKVSEQAEFWDLVKRLEREYGLKENPDHVECSGQDY